VTDGVAIPNDGHPRPNHGCRPGTFGASDARAAPSLGIARDKTVAMTSTGSHFKRWVFSRHSHPLSAWTRWASTPLVLLPVWNRSARQGVVVATWLALNPVLFPPPRDDSAFATRAVLGEEKWLEERPVSAALAINCMASAALLIAIDSARRRRASQMTIATIGSMGALLWYWWEMVRFYETHGEGQWPTATGPHDVRR
jgi:hypothetical protein